MFLSVPSSSTPRAPVSQQTFQTPAETLARQAIHTELIDILASTANGCIRELGYPTLTQEYDNLQKKYLDLKHRYAVREQDYISTTTALRNRIAALEYEVTRLTKDNTLLRQTQNLHADEKYRLLDKKYHYILHLLRDHHRLPEADIANRPAADIHPDPSSSVSFQLYIRVCVITN